jgi:hypothetical protein
MESSSTAKPAISIAASQSSIRRQTAFVSLLLVVYTIWIGLLLIGHTVLFEYELTAGPLTNTKRIFPNKTSIPLTHSRQNLILFLHPACPCSVATVEEFRELMREGEKDSMGTVVFFMPREKESEWSLMPIISSVKRIPNVSVLFDTNGGQAEIFGAATSGHVFVYDGRGILQFSGGITGARGHTGDNQYLEVAKKTIISKNPKFATTPVFGCSLRGIQ